MSLGGYITNCKHFLKPFFSPKFTLGERQAFAGNLAGSGGLRKPLP